MLTWSYVFWASVLYFLVAKWSKVWMKPSIKRRDQNHMFGQNVRYFVQIIKLGKKGFSSWHANVKQKISLKLRPFSLFQLYLCSIVLRFDIAIDRNHLLFIRRQQFNWRAVVSLVYIKSLDSSFNTFFWASENLRYGKTVLSWY